MRARVRLSLAASAILACATAIAAGGAASLAAAPAGARSALAASVRTDAFRSAVAEPATALLPPAGSVLTGVSAGSAGRFAAQAGKHPAVFGEFVTWGQSIHWAFNEAAAAHARLILHISTSQGYGAPQKITPAGIAQGAGDAYLISLGRLIASHQRPVYVRLLPEMDQANNAYCAFNVDGSSRGPLYAPSEFVAAWRRTVIVLRGGPVAGIDAQLTALGLPPLHGLPAGASLPTPNVAFVWTPQVAGSPDIPANSPAAYYPGSPYVDWVGTDFYSRFPNFTGLETFYKEYPGKPFAFGEWAVWGADDPAFVDDLFKWVDAHRRVQMMLYNQGYGNNGPLDLGLYPQSTAAVRTQLAASRYLAFTTEWGGSAG
jgi:hypothetical protein